MARSVGMQCIQTCIHGPFEHVQPLRSHSAIHDAVVAAQRDAHLLDGLEGWWCTRVAPIEYACQNDESHYTILQSTNNNLRAFVTTIGELSSGLGTKFV